MMPDAWIVGGIAAWLMTAVVAGAFIGRRRHRSRRKHSRSGTGLAQRHAHPHAAPQDARRGRHTDEHVSRAHPTPDTLGSFSPPTVADAGRRHQPDDGGPRDPRMRN
jgi:hypothetical protein